MICQDDVHVFPAVTLTASLVRDSGNTLDGELAVRVVAGRASCRCGRLAFANLGVVPLALAACFYSWLPDGFTCPEGPPPARHSCRLEPGHAGSHECRCWAKTAGP